ncbi:MAG: ferritin family protein [bacterium]|nr:ferritin family protein [bacterium]
MNKIKPVEIALEMEKDGLKFYLESAAKASNKLIKDLLISLAKDEEEHYNSFLIIYDSFKKNNNWPDNIEIKANHDSKTIFKKYANENRKKIKKAKYEMDIVKTALEIEKKSFEFYKEISEEIKENNIKMFFKKLAEIENEHYELLDNTFNYLNNPTEWFVKEEKPIFEGQ